MLPSWANSVVTQLTIEHSPAAPAHAHTLLQSPVEIFVMGQKWVYL